MQKRPHKNEKLCQQIQEELCKSAEKIDGWGSIEVVIQNYVVTQVTEKNIRKPLKNSTKKI